MKYLYTIYLLQGVALEKRPYIFLDEFWKVTMVFTFQALVGNI